MKIIVGLGNPGAQYASTPHSVGFEVVDKLAQELGVEWEIKRQMQCLFAKGVIAGESVLVIKPQTFMNLSGDAVAPMVKYHNLGAADLVVVQDDIDLALGRLRVRKGGSSGGHNGIRNIIERLGASDFARLKLGVGKDKSDVIGHVLGKFDPASRKVMDKVVDEATKAVKCIVENGADAAMNAYNGWQA